MVRNPVFLIYIFRIGVVEQIDKYNVMMFFPNNDFRSNISVDIYYSGAGREYNYNGERK
jgi:hypothetical protein